MQMDNFLYLNNNNEVAANPGDTVYLSGDYLNYLSPTSANFKVTISCASPYVGLIDSVFYAGVIPTLGIVSNASAPLQYCN